jgi:hypothetical protein
MKNLGEDSRSSGRDLNPGRPEYDAEMLITRPRPSRLGLFVTEKLYEGNRLCAPHAEQKCCAKIARGI